jgi:membrane-bound ClpP family serine protease
VYLLNTRLDSTYFTVFVLLLIVVNFLTIYWAFNSTLWKRFSLETTFDKSLEKINLSIGQIGITKSVIRPMGNADFEGITYEVTSDGNFIEKGVDIKIVSIVNRKIIVKPLIS